MKQQGNSINPGNIQHFADSAKNAIQLGQRQFYTPPDLSEALCCVYQNNAATIATDLMAGSGHLLIGSGRPHTCGIDVDERVTSLRIKGGGSFYQADITRYYPLAHAAGLYHDLILINPPFSLQWYLDRLAPLATSSVTGAKEAFAAALAQGETMDSTLASLLIALDSLTPCGEGFMVCNADTARRLIGDPQGPANPLMRNIWCWLDIPGALYEGQHTPFPTAVLYFSASHGKACADDRMPLYLQSPSPDPQTVRATLATAISARPFAFCGRAITYDYQASRYKEDFLPVWAAVRGEYHQLHHGAPPEWNLSLTPDGKIRTFLDPYRKAAYVHNRELLLAFREMSGQSPAALVVQQASRAALKHAMGSGTWRVQPELVAAVQAACDAYESVRAPFYTPSEVQSLGWLDEESIIRCSSPGIPGFRPDRSYPIRSWIENTVWSDKRKNFTGGNEDLELSGRELVVEVLDDDESPHHFHVRRDDSSDLADSSGRKHHHITSLIGHFHIPVPKDVAQSNPQAYQHNLDRLTKLESLVNA